MNRNLKFLATLLPILVMTISVPPAHAGRVEPTSVSCGFFRGENVELNQTCIYESVSWAGGGVGTLRWEDGVQTKMTWGLQGRGEKPCADGRMGIDGVCGVRYFRDSTTLKRISEEESQKRGMNHQSSVTCLLLQDKSICWLR